MTGNHNIIGSTLFVYLFFHKNKKSETYGCADISMWFAIKMKMIACG